MTRHEVKLVVDIIEKYMTTIYDRPAGSNPRYVLTTFGLSRVKQELETLVKGSRMPATCNDKHN